MGTRAGAHGKAARFSVSNPLGWDGDASMCLNPMKQPNVSNPLGWDGDFAMSTAFDFMTMVSNPLGWDGDSTSMNTMCG